jgi:hypothetical protein
MSYLSSALAWWIIIRGTPVLLRAGERMRIAIKRDLPPWLSHVLLWPVGE